MFNVNNMIFNQYINLINRGIIVSFLNLKIIFKPKCSVVFSLEVFPIFIWASWICMQGFSGSNPGESFFP